MGFHTIDLALFVPADLAVQAKNWLQDNYNNRVRAIGLIRDDDPDSQAVRYWGIHLRVTPEMYSEIKKLSEQPAFSSVVIRASQQGNSEVFRDSLWAEAATRGWRKKP